MPGLDNYAQPLDQLKSFHEWLAETVAKHSPRLAAYAYTNPFGGDEMLDQTAQTVRDGGFVGLIVNTSVKGEYLDSERADPFFEMAVGARRARCSSIRRPSPWAATACADFRLVEQVGRFMDVTVGLATLVFSGTARAASGPAVHRGHRRRGDRAPGRTARPGVPAAALGRQAGAVAGRPVAGRPAAGRPR